MTMKFREHRGSLADSMATLVELEPTYDALVKHINTVVSPSSFNGVITVKLYVSEPDDRIGWPRTFIVSDQHGPIGFTDQIPWGLTDEMSKRAIEVAQKRIHPLLAGLGPDVQAAVLADLVATYLAGHQGPDAGKMREELLALHVEAVRALIPVNEAMLLTNAELKGLKGSPR